MNTAIIRLEGPLQSWGVRARWDVRDTAMEPTKSGVIGMISCALGWGRGADVDIRDLGASLRFGVRVERPGLIVRDYHTVYGGALAANRKIKITASTKEPETIVSPRFYLADASFAAVLQGQADVIARISDAMQSPTWPFYLGRKSCVASMPPWEGSAEYGSLEEALSEWPRSERSDEGPLRAQIEVDAGRGTPRPDQIQTLSSRTYLQRFAEEILVDPPAADLEA